MDSNQKVKIHIRDYTRIIKEWILSNHIDISNTDWYVLFDLSIGLKHDSAVCNTDCFIFDICDKNLYMLAKLKYGF